MDEARIFYPSDPAYEEKVRVSFARQQFMDFIGARLVTVQPGFCEIHLPYKRDLSQQHGFFHAGVIGSIADNACGYAAYTLMPAGSSVLTVEYKLNLLTPGSGDLLIASAHVVRAGRTLTICQGEVSVVKGEQQKLCAIALVTLMTMEGKPEIASDSP